MNEKQAVEVSHHKKPIFSMLFLFGVMLVIGIFRMPYLYRFFVIGCGVLLIVNAFLFFHGRSLKWYGFRYTRPRFYLFLLVLLLPCILIRPPMFFWIKFITFGILGILGESLVGLCFEQVFRKKFWLYQKDTIFSGYSSWLCIIPWGLGGTFYDVLTRKALFIPTAEELLIFWSITLFLFLLVSVWRNFKKNNQSTTNSRIFHSCIPFSLFCISPIILTNLLTSNYHILVAALFYSAGGWIMEYFLGKIMAFIFTDKLWVYKIDPMDNGHLTLWALPLFAFNGFCFITISHIFTYF